jgi:sugar lactone lactonase YvrE
VPKVNGTFPLGSNLDANNKLVAAPDGNIWLTLSSAEKAVARVTPAGAVHEFELENVTFPSGIAVGPEGDLWLTQKGGVARFSPSNPEGTLELTPIAQIEAAASIVAGGDGNMWVATDENLIKIPPAAPAKFVPTEIKGLAPKDIDAVGSLLVIADAGEPPQIVTVTTAGFEKDYPIAGQSQGVATSPTGQIGYSQQSKEPEQFGVISPPNPAQAFDVPATDPFGVAFGADGNFWGVQSAKDGVTRFTPTGTLTFFGGFPKESMARQIAAGPGNTLWVTLTKNEAAAVGRITGLEPPLVAVPPAPLIPAPARPRSRIERGPKKTVKIAARFTKVRFRFSSTTPGATFQCALQKIRRGRRAPRPQFRACASPKAFRIGPGKYRFSVRALSAGLVDTTPATSSFRIVRVR